MPRLGALPRWLPSDVYFWLKAFLLALVAIQGARLVWTVITPVGLLGEWRQAMPRQLAPAVQTSLLSSFDPFNRVAAPVPGQAAALPSDLLLFGTLAGPNASAIIGKQGGEQQSYVIGEEVAPGIKLAAVLFDRVVLDSGGQRSELLMPMPEGMTPPAGSSTGPSSAATQAFDLQARQSGGQVTGVIIGGGANDAVVTAVGLRKGDVILSVNGARISSIIDLQQLQTTLVPGARLTLSVERGGRTFPLAVNVPAAT